MHSLHEDEALGAAAKDALLGWRSWVHRRVESLHLLSGERGTRRVSLDCTPPPDPGLAYVAVDRTAGTLSEVTGPIQVPMALIEKGAMRDLDVLDSELRPMPVLGRRENGSFATAALLALFRSDMSRELPAALAETLAAIVRCDREDAEPIAERLLTRGRCLDGTVVNAPVSDLTVLWTKDLASNFLLVGLVPASRAGQRQVLKWSANWHLEGGSMKGGRRLAVAAGYDVAEIGLPISGATAASGPITLRSTFRSSSLERSSSFLQSAPVNNPRAWTSPVTLSRTFTPSSTRCPMSRTPSSTSQSPGRGFASSLPPPLV